MNNTFFLRKGNAFAEIADPLAGEPYYRGTRFDRTGIILSLESCGHSFVRPWFLRYDPFMHDAVSGPSEEFTQIGYESAAAGEEFLKLGVGRLVRDGAPYDRFNPYKVADAGRMTIERSASSAVFRHELGGTCDYVKTVELLDETTLKISHSLRNCGNQPLEFHVYSHNFFILDGAFTGRDTRFSFPFRPEGDWRSPYDSVALTENGIEFSRDLNPGESVFMGNLKAATPLLGRDFPDTPFSFRLSNAASGLSVLGSCDRAMEYAVFWSNHEVACLEPYVPMRIMPAGTASWTLTYRFFGSK